MVAKNLKELAYILERRDLLLQNTDGGILQSNRDPIGYAHRIILIVYLRSERIERKASVWKGYRSSMEMVFR